MEPEVEKIVAQLREALPSIISELNLKDSNNNIWGVPLNKNSTALDKSLAKFVIAREKKFEDAKKMLTDCLTWRKEQDIEKLLKEDLKPFFQGIS